MEPVIINGPKPKARRKTNMPVKKATSAVKRAGRRVPAWLKKEKNQELMGVALGGALTPTLANQVRSYLPAGIDPTLAIGAGGALLAMRGKGAMRGVGLAFVAYGAQALGAQLGAMFGTAPADEANYMFGAGLPAANQAALMRQAEARARAFLGADEANYLTYSGDEANYLASANGQRFTI